MLVKLVCSLLGTLYSLNNNYFLFSFITQNICKITVKHIASIYKKGCFFLLCIVFTTFHVYIPIRESMSTFMSLPSSSSLGLTHFHSYLNVYCLDIIPCFVIDQNIIVHISKFFAVPRERVGSHPPVLAFVC